MEALFFTAEGAKADKLVGDLPQLPVPVNYPAWASLVLLPLQGPDYKAQVSSSLNVRGCMKASVYPDLSSETASNCIAMKRVKCKGIFLAWGASAHELSGLKDKWRTPYTSQALISPFNCSLKVAITPRFHCWRLCWLLFQQWVAWWHGIFPNRCVSQRKSQHCHWASCIPSSGEPSSYLQHLLVSDYNSFDGDFHSKASSLENVHKWSFGYLWVLFMLEEEVENERSCALLRDEERE